MSVDGEKGAWLTYDVGDGRGENVDDFGTKIRLRPIKEHFGALVNDDQCQVVDGRDLALINGPQMVANGSMDGRRVGLVAPPSSGEGRDDGV